MTGEQRREKILEYLRQADGPMSGTALAKALGVSRQIIVQDMALLRAQRDAEILSTYQGYVIRPQEQRFRQVFQVRHSAERTQEELETIVDLGGRVEDVFVCHQVYGVVRGELHIRSRRDIRDFLERLRGSSAAPLMCLTDDVHFHTVCAEDRETLEQIGAQLEAMGILVS